jgi:hypothetical protein
MKRKPVKVHGKLHASVTFDRDSGLWEAARRDDNDEIERTKFASRDEAVSWLGIKQPTVQ